MMKRSISERFSISSHRLGPEDVYYPGKFMDLKRGSPIVVAHRFDCLKNYVTAIFYYILGPIRSRKGSYMCTYLE